MKNEIRASIPRNANGWPVIGPEMMTYAQLICEAESWKGCHEPGTVGHERRKQYADELLRRGFSTRLEHQEGILPCDVPGPEAAERHKKWLAGEAAGWSR